MRALLAALILCAGTSSCAVMPAYARDNGQFADNALKPWFDSLRSHKGYCCSDADGREDEVGVSPDQHRVAHSRF